jgi:hypothetical protein
VAAIAVLALVGGLDPDSGPAPRTSTTAATAATAAIAAPRRATPPPAVETAGWRMQLLPAAADTDESLPRAVLPDGTVYGVDSPPMQPESSRPWRWTPGRGREFLQLDGRRYGRIAGITPGGPVGEVWDGPSSGSGRPVRWSGTRPTALPLPSGGSSWHIAAVSVGGGIAFHDGNGSGRLVSARGKSTALPQVGSSQVVSVDAVGDLLLYSTNAPTFPAHAASVSYSLQRGTRSIDVGLNASPNMEPCFSGLTDTGYLATTTLSSTEAQEPGKPPTPATKLATLWHHGVPAPLRGAGTDTSVACGGGVNDAGHVIGLSYTPGRHEDDPDIRPPQLMLWRDGRPQVLASGTPTRSWKPIRIGSADLVIAETAQRDPRAGALTHERLMVWSHGRWAALPQPPGLISLNVIDTNIRGQILGSGCTGDPDLVACDRRVTVLWTPPRTAGSVSSSRRSWAGTALRPRAFRPPRSHRPRSHCPRHPARPESPRTRPEPRPARPGRASRRREPQIPLLRGGRPGTVHAYPIPTSRHRRPAETHQGGARRRT